MYVFVIRLCPFLHVSLWKLSLTENCPVEQQVAETQVVVQSWVKITVLLQRISVF